ncbi:MAG: peptidase C1 [Candidatus Kapabacteria bacterium]|nr:peptidase C1 [Candidatus Kapabacteria bacterium]
MLKRFFTLVLLALFFFPMGSYSQKDRIDKGVFIDYKSEFWDTITTKTEQFKKRNDKKKLIFKMDFTGIDLPKSINEFKTVWHNEPISQGITGTCWCFSTTSYLESEIYRLTGKKMKISRMFTVYWEYVEKARRFVREFGNSEFGEGSQANAVTKIWKTYGCVPDEIYTGLKPDQPFHDHSEMFSKMKTYLESIKRDNNWNEEIVVNTIKSILNHYLSTPPENFEFQGKKWTPKQFLNDYVKINPDDFIDVISILEKPYYTKIEYPVPDNWRKDSTYYNIPLDEFMNILVEAIKNGYSSVIGGDVSEAGILSQAEVAMVPSFDIPSSYINDYARQFRFSNQTTTDDHGIHIVGITEKENGIWFLIKDSGAGAFNGSNKGYYFFHYDFVKLKMMTFMLHKSALTKILNKF